MSATVKYQGDMMTLAQCKAFLARIESYDASLTRCNKHDVKYLGKVCPLCMSDQAWTILGGQTFG